MANRERNRPKTAESVQSGQETTTPPRNIDKSIGTITHVALEAHNYVPFLWTGRGAMSLAMGNVWPAVLGSAGMFLIGGWGFGRAYRTTFRFYRGQATRKNTPRRPKVEKIAAVRRNALERQLPFVPEEAAALSLAFFRSLMRAPEVKMALAMNVIMLLVFGSIFFLRRSASIDEKFSPFIATGAIAFMFLGMIQLMFNQFGFDRSGFRKLVLLPVPRKYILLGKNLAILPIAFGTGGILLVFIKIFMGISLVVIIAASFQLAAAFLLFSMMGNLLSVLVPYRIAPGSLKATKVPALTTLLLFVSHLLFPIAMIPVFLPAALGLLSSSLGWLPAARVNIFFSAVLLILLALFYRLSLTGLGNLLQRREKKILQVVTQEVE
jgi:hypothetical protein